MKEQLKIVFQIGCQTWWMSSNKASKTKLWIYFSILPLICLIMGATIRIKDGGVESEWIFLALVLGLVLDVIVILIAWFMTLCEVVKMQYSPANAKLLPHIKRHLQLALGVPLLIFPLIVLITQSVIENELRMGAWSGVLFAMLSYCIFIRSPWGLSLFFFSFQLPRLVKIDFLKPMMASNDIKLLLVALSFVLIIVVLNWTFSMSEKAIFNVQKRNFKGLLDQNNLKNTYFMSRFFNSPYLMWMNFRIKKINSIGRRNRSSLQVFGLSPNIHWVTNFFTTMSIVIVMCAFIVVMEFFESYSISSIKSMSDFSLGLLLVVVPTMPLFYVLNFSVAIYQCRREHGLLQLVPFGLKNNHLQKLSESLLRDFGIQFFVLWIVGLCVSLYLAISADFTLKKVTIVLLGNLVILFSSLTIFYRQNKRVSLHDSKLMLFVFMGITILFISVYLVWFVGIYFAWGLAVLLLILYGLSLKIIFSMRKKDEIIFPAGRAA